MLVTPPLPPIVALLIHETRRPKYKKRMQSFSCMPHFTPCQCPAAARQIGPAGKDTRADPLQGDLKCFRHIVAWSGGRKGTGWGTIIRQDSPALAGRSERNFLRNTVPWQPDGYLPWFIDSGITAGMLKSP